MDISDTLAPNSDQLDAVDLLSGPRTFTIEKVSKGDAEQPVNIHLAEFPRPWRPGKSMRRVLVAAWGPDASAYVGRRVTLYCDPEVRFGGAAVGGGVHCCGGGGCGGGSVGGRGVTACGGGR